MSAPWRDKEPFRCIGRVFKSALDYDGALIVNRDRELSEAMTAALLDRNALHLAEHEMDDLNARIAALESALRDLVDVVETLCGPVLESTSQQEECPLCHRGEHRHYSDCPFVVGREALTRAESVLKGEDNETR